MGHTRTKKFRSQSKQLHLGEAPHWKFRFCHGGTLRNRRHGRKARPLSTKDPIHLVFKCDKSSVRRGFRSPLGFAIITRLIKTFAKRFFIKIDQYSINHDHIHFVIRIHRRSLHHYFLRVIAGQIAQEFLKEGFMKVTDTPARPHATQSKVADLQKQGSPKPLWKYRPFTRVVKGWKPYLTVMNYVRLNEKEVRGEIPYRKNRLRGMSSSEWEVLWS